MTDGDGIPTIALDSSVVVDDCIRLVQSILAKVDDRTAVVQLIGAAERDHGAVAVAVFGMAVTVLVNPILMTLINRLELAGVDIAEIRDLISAPFVSAKD